ncbi:MIP/aquaporin family protein [Streptococcus fryi]
MNAVLGEFLGTALLLLLGNGVVAGVVLSKTKNNNSGWIVITLGWGLAVAMAAFVSGKLGPAHLNPAVSLAFAVKGDISFAVAVQFILAQMLGAMLGSFLVYLQFKPHYDATEDKGAVLATFSTGPAIKDTVSNFISEVVGTFVLMLGILAIVSYDMQPGLATISIGLLIVSIGLSLGGTTGYALNPARDLGPRILHALLPLKHKGDSDWEYAWLPVVAPVVGAILAVVVYGGLF